MRAIISDRPRQPSDVCHPTRKSEGVSLESPYSESAERSDTAHISTEARHMGGASNVKENQPMNATSVSNELRDYRHLAANGVQGVKHRPDRANFGQYWEAGGPKNQVEGKQGPSDAERPYRKRPELSKVSLQDPWGADHPARAVCDEFLQTFRKAYAEVLEEKGFTPKSGGYDTLILPAKEMDGIRRSLAEKLASDPKSVELMRQLNVDLSSSGETAANVRNDEEHVAGPALDGGIMDANGIINKDAWRRKYQEAIANDDYSSFMRLRDPDNPRVGIPNVRFFMDVQVRGPNDSEAVPDIVRFLELHAKIEDEVIKELGLDPAKLEPDGPEALAALKIVGERLMADPLGQELIQKTGLTSVNYQGLPCAPGYEKFGKLDKGQGSVGIDDLLAGGETGPRLSSLAKYFSKGFHMPCGGLKF